MLNIILGYGLEYNQPAIIAEALAQAAIHNNNLMVEYFSEFDSIPPATDTTKTFSTLLKECRDDPTLRDSVKLSDGQAIKGLFSRAKTEMCRVANQWVVKEEKDIERMTAEVVNGAGELKTLFIQKFIYTIPSNISFYSHTSLSLVFVPSVIHVNIIYQHN